MNSVLPNDLHDVEIVATFSEPLEQPMLDALPGGLQFGVNADSIRLEPRA